jgi:hypothetical protein
MPSYHLGLSILVRASSRTVSLSERTCHEEHVKRQEGRVLDGLTLVWFCLRSTRDATSLLGLSAVVLST